MAQTIGSASTSLATGTIFTIPALFLWGLAPPYWQVVAARLLGGLLGLAAMIPLRRLLIVEAHHELPYPEGTACAEVLRATTTGAGGSAWIFRGIAVGALVKLAGSLLFLMPTELRLALPVLPRAELAIEVAPALLAVGFILGYRQAAVVVAGAVISSLALIPLIAWIGAGLPGPLYPETALRVADMDAGQIWARYIRYIGAGAVATAGILTVAAQPPDHARRLHGCPSGHAQRDSLRPSERPAPIATCPAASSPGDRRSSSWSWPRARRARRRHGPARAPDLRRRRRRLRLLFVTVAARIVGIVGVSSQPTSGITLVTLLGTASLFAAFGWVDPAPARPCSRSAPSSRSPPPRPATSRRISRPATSSAPPRPASSSASSSAPPVPAGPSPRRSCCCRATASAARSCRRRRRP
jgi:hypothetical protein